MSSTEDSHLYLTNPTEEERLRCWKGSHPLWGAALTLDGYIGREQRQLEIPLARDGGLTNWILTSDKLREPDGSRPVLSSCETLKKRALVKGRDGTIREGTAHGVASVFTEPQFRRNGYATVMMRELAKTLAKAEREGKGSAMLSVLYSDIGKEFYAANGWFPHRSEHVEFPASSAEPPSPPGALSIIHFDDLPPLVAADEQLVRSRVARSSPSDRPAVRAAVLPDLDQIQWHLAREGFVTDQLFSRRATIHGALYSTQSGPRVWAIWTRSYSGTVAEPDKNTLFFLRFVVEEGVKHEELGEALGVIVAVARKQASDWACASVQIWNPDDNVRNVAEELGAKHVVRSKDSITSLQSFGDIAQEKIEWVTNEKYAWC